MIVQKNVICPNCNEILGIAYDFQKYCDNCGTKLDWSKIIKNRENLTGKKAEFRGYSGNTLVIKTYGEPTNTKVYHWDDGWRAIKLNKK